MLRMILVFLISNCFAQLAPVLLPISYNIAQMNNTMRKIQYVEGLTESRGVTKIVIDQS